jgi:hypothetical protein
VKLADWLAALVGSIIVVLIPFAGEQHQALRSNNYLVNQMQSMSYCIVTTED